MTDNIQQPESGSISSQERYTYGYGDHAEKYAKRKAVQEAAFLIEGFRTGRYPPSLNSVRPEIDANRLREWWANYYSDGEPNNAYLDSSRKAERGREVSKLS